MLNFGYHPLPEETDVVLQLGRFERAIVVDSEVTDLFELCTEVRTLASLPVALPRGIYWFHGTGDSTVLVVPTGTPGSSSRLELVAEDSTKDHPLVNAYGWARSLWSQAVAVPTPKFVVGSRAVTIPAGTDVEVTGRSFYNGAWTYRARGPEGVRDHLENKLEPIQVSDEPADWVLEEPAPAVRFGATLTRTKLLGKFADTIYSFGATRTVFRPYQFKPVLKLLQSGLARLLIADEVGLGKTIEAGLIWTELEARQEADRVLIVCPAGLVDKWRNEMEDRFGFELTNLDRAGRLNFVEAHRQGRLPKRRAYVASIESLRKWDALEEFKENPPEFDLIIVDEAHSMRNAARKNYQLGTQLSDWTSGSNLVFLSATPVNLHETDLLNLLGLLDSADFASLDDLKTRLEPNEVLTNVSKMIVDKRTTFVMVRSELAKLAQMVFGQAITLRPEFDDLVNLISEMPFSPRQISEARTLIGRLNTLSSAVTRTRRAEIDEKKAVREADPAIEVQWTKVESAFYEEFLKWCEERARLAATPMYFSMQMPIRLASTTLKLAAETVLARENANLVGEDVVETPRGWVEPHEELVSAARAVQREPDTKLARLVEVLSKLHEQQRPSLLFTWSKANLRYLQSALEGDYRIAVMSGDVSRDARRNIMRDFREGKYDFVFANRVASEGLDFEFCSAVINYDLPWNPMEIEQRIGRIDRIGQQSEKILIRNFYNNEAIDSRIMFKVLQRIEIFEKSIGEMDEIIGKNMDALRSAIDFSLTPEQREAKAEQFLTAIEAQKAASTELADSAASLMISNDIEISGLRDDLLATGRYLGQIELANLINDWAKTDGGQEISWVLDQKVAELTGNATMASRVNDLSDSGRRTRTETRELLSALQNGSPIHIALDQEVARTSGIGLLSATHPLVLAAAEVPGHKHARFANISIPATDGIEIGTYLAVIGLAANASMGGDEIWGAAVDLNGAELGSAPVDALLAALATGQISEGSPIENRLLPYLAKRAKLQLQSRHSKTQEKRDKEQAAWAESRKSVLTDQHSRRIDGINRRLETVRARDRGEGVQRMIEGQIRRQEERHQLMMAEIENRTNQSISLKYLAVCTLEVRNAE